MQLRRRGRRAGRGGRRIGRKTKSLFAFGQTKMLKRTKFGNYVLSIYYSIFMKLEL